jgi:hypothetical protein
LTFVASRACTTTPASGRSVSLMEATYTETPPSWSFQRRRRSAGRSARPGLAERRRASPGCGRSPIGFPDRRPTRASWPPRWRSAKSTTRSSSGSDCLTSWPANSLTTRGREATRCSKRERRTRSLGRGLGLLMPDARLLRAGEHTCARASSTPTKGFSSPCAGAAHGRSSRLDVPR